MRLSRQPPRRRGAEASARPPAGSLVILAMMALFAIVAGFAAVIAALFPALAA